MDPAALIASLVEFYSIAEIRGFWKQAADAMMSRAAVNIHITSSTFEGQTGTGMVLATAAEQSAFIQACRAAIAQLGGVTTTPVDQLGVGVDFSRSMVQP